MTLSPLLADAFVTICCCCCDIFPHYSHMTLSSFHGGCIYTDFHTTILPPSTRYTTRTFIRTVHAFILYCSYDISSLTCRYFLVVFCHCVGEHWSSLRLHLLFSMPFVGATRVERITHYPPLLPRLLTQWNTPGVPFVGELYILTLLRWRRTCKPAAPLLIAFLTR